jgi:hypothetical protein
MTTTQELIKKADHLAVETWVNGEGLGGEVSETFTNLAKRLQELDKPYCVYTLCADDSPTPQTLESACGGAMWYLGDDGKGAYPKFCHHCGGVVKEAT